MLAVFNGSAAAVDALICAGADVNAADWNGMTPLMLAVSQASESEEKVKLLLASGANPQLLSGEGKMALEYAQEFARLVSEGQNDRVVRQALKNGCADKSLLEDVGHGVKEMMDRWPRVIALLEGTGERGIHA
jgi:ankyrin repeat protein